MDNNTFETPIGITDDNGDIKISGGEPKPQPQAWALADLERDHPVFHPTGEPVLSEAYTEVSGPELAESTLPLQHKLSRDTRIRGLGHIARIREDMAARQAKDSGQPRFTGTDTDQASK